MKSSNGKWLILSLFIISCFASKRTVCLFDFKETNAWKGITGNTEVTFQVNEVKEIWSTGIITLTSESGSREYGVRGFQKGYIYPCRIDAGGDEGEVSIFINGRQSFDSIMLEIKGWRRLQSETVVTLYKVKKSDPLQ